LPYLYEDLDLALRLHQRDGFRLLYNRAAHAEHLQAVDLESWKLRVARIAEAERQFVTLHPEIPPYFHNLFSEALARRATRGYGERLAHFVPAGVPWLGPSIWSRADLFYRQALAPAFLQAWDAATPATSTS
jgi:hypothetical protein